jgi:hypothetical protein
VEVESVFRAFAVRMPLASGSSADAPTYHSDNPTAGQELQATIPGPGRPGCSTSVDFNDVATHAVDDVLKRCHGAEGSPVGPVVGRACGTLLPGGTPLLAGESEYPRGRSGQLG